MNIINIFIVINIFSFSITTLDKILAIYKKRRISEKTLLTIAFLGGSIGTMTAMIISHHKTQKLKFKILIPLFIILHIVLIIIFIK